MPYAGTAERSEHEHTYRLARYFDSGDDPVGDGAGDKILDWGVFQSSCLASSSIAGHASR
jgi:hypothetical protein